MENLLHQSEAKVESPSLDELLDISSNNALGETAATTTATTTTTSSPSSTSSSTTTASPKKAKKDTANISNNNKKNGDSKDDEEDHISKLDIRVGIVRSVERHPDAESLYVEQVDVGDSNDDGAASPSTSSATGAAPTTRTIVSGLVKYIPKDYLEGRAVIVVRNMKPSKLRGVMSQGMLLCGMEKDSDGQVTKVELLEPAEGSQPGDKVTFEGFTDESTLPVPVLTPKRRWFEKTQIHFTVQDGIAFYKGSPFKTVRGLVRCRSINKGEIS
ncbi:hypothetical protein BGW41_005731 [Actinomortierella wolfii]|nr:hypothetical protein BGW41_005731 [Actinomortierella wolfii]